MASGSEDKKSYLDPYCEDHPIFGPTSNLEGLSKEKLPTKFQLLNVIRGLKKPFIKPGGFIERDHQIKVYSDVTKILTEIWNTKAKIPVPEFSYARTTLEKFFEDILHTARRTRDRILETEESKNSYISKLSKVYNFARCKCFISAKNIYKVEAFEDVSSANCKCKPKDRIPDQCLCLYADQMFNRELVIWFSENDIAQMEQEQNVVGKLP